jgi:hypothetical protein
MYNIFLEYSMEGTNRVTRKETGADSRQISGKKV